MRRPSVALPQPRPGKRPAGQDPEAGRSRSKSPQQCSEQTRMPVNSEQDSCSLDRRLTARSRTGVSAFERTLEGCSSAFHHLKVRNRPPQPASPAFGDSLQPAPYRPGNPGFFGIRLSLQTPGLLIYGEKWRKVSGRFPKNSRFTETIGGDRFDHDCCPTLALSFGSKSP